MSDCRASVEVILVEYRHWYCQPDFWQRHTKAYRLLSLFLRYLPIQKCSVIILGENCTRLPRLKEADERWSGYHQSSFGCCGHLVGDVDNVSITLISAPWRHRGYSPLLQRRRPLVSQSPFAESVRVGVGSRWVVVQYEHVRFFISLSLQRSYVLIMGPAFDGTLRFEWCVSIFNRSAKKQF